jgi:hypothetical protein
MQAPLASWNAAKRVMNKCISALVYFPNLRRIFPSSPSTRITLKKKINRRVETVAASASSCASAPPPPQLHRQKPKICYTCLALPTFHETRRPITASAAAARPPTTVLRDPFNIGLPSKWRPPSCFLLLHPPSYWRVLELLFVCRRVSASFCV